MNSNLPQILSWPTIRKLDGRLPSLKWKRFINLPYNNLMVVTIYQDEYGNEPFSNWLESIEDKIVYLRIRKRLRRIERGNLGDYRLVGEGVIELRLHFGPGYRVYCSQVGNEIILLLTGGDKSTQERDIHGAKHYLYDYKRNQ